VDNATPRTFYPRERPGTHCIGGWVGPRAEWTGVENLAPTAIRFPDRPARSESVYRLRYRVWKYIYIYIYIYILYSVDGTTTWLRDWLSVFRIPRAARNFTLLQSVYTGSGSTKPLHRASLPGAKRSDRRANSTTHFHLLLK